MEWSSSGTIITRTYVRGCGAPQFNVRTCVCTYCTALHIRMHMIVELAAVWSWLWNRSSRAYNLMCPSGKSAVFAVCVLCVLCVRWLCHESVVGPQVVHPCCVQ